MTDYNDVFSGSGAPPAESSFASYTMTTSESFYWPYNYSGSSKTIAKIMQITPSSGVVMTLPNANEVSNGEDFIIRNIGANTLTVRNSAAGAVTTVTAGSAVYIYVTDNSTAAGTWGIVSYGTGTSSADAATLAGYGLAASGANLIQKSAVYTSATGFTINNTYRAKTINYTGGVGTLSFSAVSTLTDGFFVYIHNSGTGTLTLDPNSTETIDGVTSIDLQPGESVQVVCSGAELITVGLGRSTQYQFTQLTKDVTSGNVTLSSTEASNKLLTFIGSPGATRTVTVPSIVSVYYVYNNLSTAYDVTLKTSGGVGSAVAQTQRAILFCDGTDVYAAQSVAVTSALSMLDGTSSSPGLNFATQTNTGLYKDGTQDLGISVNGSSVAVFTSDGLTTAPSGNLIATNLNAALAELQADIDTRQVTDATLTALAGLATGANKIPYSTNTDTFDQLDFSTSTSLGASDTTVSSQNAVKSYVDTGLSGKQTSDATLTALAGLATGANKIPYSTGTDAFDQLDFSTNTSLGVSDTTVSSQNAVKSYVDTQVATKQTSDATLTALAGLTTGANKIPYSTSTDVFDQLDFSTSTSLGASDTTVSSQNAVKSYVDTQVATKQTSDATLTALAGVTTAADTLIYATASDTFTTTSFTSTARNLLDDTSTTAMRTTLGAAADASTQTIYVPASAMVPRTTNGAAIGTAETTTNKVMLKTLDFDASTAEYAQFSLRMPKGWNESTITAVFSWSVASGTGNVVWGCQGLARSNDDVLDTAFGTAQTVTDGVTASTDLMVSAATSAITIGGTPAEEDWVAFQVYRDAASGSDTFASDARLHGVTIYYTTTSLSDA